MTAFIHKLRTLWYVLKYQYVFKKITFGPKVVIQCKLDIKGPGTVFVGANCRFMSDPWGSDYVTIYTHQPNAKIVIGNNVVLRATRFGSHLSIIVNDHAALEYSSIFDSDFHNLDATKRDDNFNEGDRPVIIGEGTYVGCECLCSKGTSLGKNAILLPGTVIGTKRIPDNVRVCGNPARILKGK